MSSAAWDLPPQEVQVPKSFCIIQITRIGDLLQTLVAAQNIRQQNKLIHLKLVARRQFATPILDLLKIAFDEIVLIGLKDIIKTRQSNLEDAISNIKDVIDQINNTPNTVLINLSFSKTSSYLSSLIKADFKLGIFRDHNGQLILKDKWTQFVYASVMNGGLNPFSLIDIYNFMLGVKNHANFEAEVRTSNNIVIHPFASLKKKYWAPNKWTETIFKIVKDNPKYKVTIVGSPQEISLAEEILSGPILTKYEGQISNMVGKTSILELLDLLTKSRLFVGHDSMVSHLAALTQTQSIIVPLGTVRPQETAPYLANCYVIRPSTTCYPCFPKDECNFYQCHSDIPFQILTSSIKHLMKNKLLTKKDILDNNSVFHLNSVTILKTNFTEAGLFILEDVLKEPPPLSDILRTVYRVGWLFYMESKEEVTQHPKLGRETHAALLKILTGLQYVFDLSEFGKKYSKYILEELSSSTPQIDKIRKHSEKIDEIENLLAMIKKTHPQLAPVTDYFMILKANLIGDNIVKLSESSYFAFQDSSIFVSILYDLIEKIIAENKIGQNKDSLKNNGA